MWLWLVSCVEFFWLLGLRDFFFVHIYFPLKIKWVIFYCSISPGDRSIPEVLCYFDVLVGGFGTLSVVVNACPIVVPCFFNIPVASKKTVVEYQRVKFRLSSSAPSAKLRTFEKQF